MVVQRKTPTTDGYNAIQLGLVEFVKPQRINKPTTGHLKKAGTDKSKLLSTNIYITDMKNFAEMNAAWDAWVSPGNTPARATVEAKLATPDYKVEIMVVAGK